MLNVLSRFRAMRQEKADRLAQKQLDESLAAFVVPQNPYVLILFFSHTARLLQVNLECTGVETRMVQTNSEALAKMRIIKPQVLITALIPYRADGLDLLAAVRGDPELAGISVVMLRSKEQDKTSPDVEKEGKTVYFSVPCPPQEFVAVVRDLMDGVERVFAKS